MIMIDLVVWQQGDVSKAKLALAGIGAVLADSIMVCHRETKPIRLGVVSESLRVPGIPTPIRVSAVATGG